MGDITLTNPTDIANAFNDYFVGCATNLLAKRSPNHKPESHPGSAHIAPPLPNTAHNFQFGPVSEDYTSASQIKTKQPMWTRLTTI
ncbi:hypothetical protein FKM82_027687 [Ascaphus truei]